MRIADRKPEGLADERAEADGVCQHRYRITRLVVGFSKKLDDLKASVSMFIAYYNFCWRPRENGNSGKLRPTAAMACGITDTLWSIESLFDEVTDYAKREKQIARYQKRAKKLKSYIQGG